MVTSLLYIFCFILYILPCISVRYHTVGHKDEHQVKDICLFHVLFGW